MTSAPLLEQVVATPDGTRFKVSHPTVSVPDAWLVSADLRFELERFRLSSGLPGWAEEVAASEAPGTRVKSAQASYAGGSIATILHEVQTTGVFTTRTRELTCVFPGHDVPLETFVRLLERLSLDDFDATGRIMLKRKSAGSVRTNTAAAHCDGVGSLQIFTRASIVDNLPRVAGRATNNGQAWAVDEDGVPPSYLLATPTAACRIGTLSDANPTHVEAFIRGLDVTAVTE